METEVLEFVKSIIYSFNLMYLVVVNLATYGIIKIIDDLNGVKPVSTWCKRIVATVIGITIGYILINNYNAESEKIFYSFFLSFISWDYLFKPIVKRLGTKFDYKHKD